jgi:hypothetical protein
MLLEHIASSEPSRPRSELSTMVILDTKRQRQQRQQRQHVTISFFHFHPFSISLLYSTKNANHTANLSSSHLVNKHSMLMTRHELTFPHPSTPRNIEQTLRPCLALSQSVPHSRDLVIAHRKHALPQYAQHPVINMDFTERDQNPYLSANAVRRQHSTY